MSMTSQIFLKIYIYRIPFDCWEGVASFLDQSQSKVKVETNYSRHPIENCFKGIYLGDGINALKTMKFKIWCFKFYKMPF